MRSPAVEPYRDLALTPLCVPVFLLFFSRLFHRFLSRVRIGHTSASSYPSTSCPLYLVFLDKKFYLIIRHYSTNPSLVCLFLSLIVFSPF